MGKRWLELGRQMALKLRQRGLAPAPPPVNLDTSVFENVIQDGSERARFAMAKQLASVLASEATTGPERALIVPLVMKLAADPAAAVRRHLAACLKPIADLEQELFFAVIADRDEIALPFLAATPALSPTHMMTILEEHDVTRQVGVALRPDISAEAREHILHECPMVVCLALLENDRVDLDEQEYRVFNDRFGQAAEISELMLARPELPPDIRVMVVKRTARRLHKLIAERGWVASNDADEIVHDSEDATILRILRESNGTELSHAMPEMVSREMLTPSIIVRAACLGEMQVVAQVLAYLAGVSIAKARDRMAGKGFTGVKGLLGKSGLPKSCHGILQAACDVAADEARQGISFTPEDFGRRLIEALMTRYESMPTRDRAQYLEFISQFADPPVRRLAKRLKTDIGKAA